LAQDELMKATSQNYHR